MSEHTAGPWTLENGCIWAKTKVGDMKIADVRGWGHLIGVGAMNLPESKAIEIQNANGYVLAAAPELLEVVRMLRSAQCIGYISRRESLPKSIEDAVNEAIAKAEGR